jgi:hypothetical protein
MIWIRRGEPERSESKDAEGELEFIWWRAFLREEWVGSLGQSRSFRGGRTYRGSIRYRLQMLTGLRSRILAVGMLMARRKIRHHEAIGDTLGAGSEHRQ